MTVQVTLIGNATSDCEIAYTPRGDARATFTLAVNERVKNEDGTWVDGDATFYRVTAWRQQAENVNTQVGKGTRVIVVGKLKPRTYETKAGEQRMSLEVTADEVGVSLRFPPKVNTPSRPITSGGGTYADDPWGAEQPAPF